MRWGIVVLLLHAAACESRYGAYLTIQGELEFDEVELYFGYELDSSGSGTDNRFATPRFGERSGLAFERKFSKFDKFASGKTTSTTFYVPPENPNRKLGAYVVAVALAGGEEVAIGEYFGFVVPSDEVHEYKLDLVAYDPDMVERWGAQPGCIAWKRARGEQSKDIVAVVHGDDRDCDELDASTDCNDLCNASVPACTVDRTLCSSAAVCGLGCTRNGVCEPSVCLPTQMCSTECASKIGLDNQYACAVASPQPHIAAVVERQGTTDIICQHTFEFDPGVPCSQPMIEYADPMFQQRFMPIIASSPNAPELCSLTVSSNGTLADGEDLHVVLSFAPDGGGARPTMIFGIRPPDTRVDQCSAVGYTIDYPQAAETLFDCK